MKLSVIIPVYNAEKYLRECVDSVLGQTENDLEIILVNDGSPDSSGAIIAEYAARYPGKVTAITVENGGQGRARNFGIDAAEALKTDEGLRAEDLKGISISAVQDGIADLSMIQNIQGIINQLLRSAALALCKRQLFACDLRL